MLREGQDRQRGRARWLRRRDQAVLSFIEWWIDFAVGIGANAVPTEQGGYVRHDASVRDHHEPAHARLVHLHPVFQV